MLALCGHSSRRALTVARTSSSVVVDTFRRSAIATRSLSSSSVSPNDDQPPVIDESIHMKNAGLGLALTGFAFGVAYYSMYAVGQASKANVDDPLAALQQEAAAARAAQADELTETENAAAMLEKFQKGEYDPDLQEQQAILEAQQADAAAASSKQRKPWWKFW